MIHRGHVLINYRLEVFPNIKRDKDTLIALIKKHTVGTEIHSDSRKAYINLEEHGYAHDTESF